MVLGPSRQAIEVTGAAFKKDRTAPRNTSWLPGRDGAGADVQCLELYNRAHRRKTLGCRLPRRADRLPLRTKNSGGPVRRRVAEKGRPPAAGRARPRAARWKNGWGFVLLLEGQVLYDFGVIRFWRKCSRSLPSPAAFLSIGWPLSTTSPASSPLRRAMGETPPSMGPWSHFGDWRLTGPGARSSTGYHRRPTSKPRLLKHEFCSLL